MRTWTSAYSISWRLFVLLCKWNKQKCKYKFIFVQLPNIPHISNLPYLNKKKIIANNVSCKCVYATNDEYKIYWYLPLPVAQQLDWISWRSLHPWHLWNCHCPGLRAWTVFHSSSFGPVIGQLHARITIRTQQSQKNISIPLGKEGNGAAINTNRRSYKYCTISPWSLLCWGN